MTNQQNRDERSKIRWFRQERPLPKATWTDEGSPKPGTETLSALELASGSPLYQRGTFAVIDTVSFGLEYSVIDTRTGWVVRSVPLDFTDAVDLANNMAASHG